MRVVVVAIGRLKAGPERELAARYSELFGAFGAGAGLDAPCVRELNESRARRASDRISEEGRAILAEVPGGADVFWLDAAGQNWSSEMLAAEIARARDAGVPACCFVIGGPDGLDRSLVKRADRCLAFGAMTWPHRLVRIMLAEQLYRAATILAGHPYHRT